MTALLMMDWPVGAFTVTVRVRVVLVFFGIVPIVHAPVAGT
jgi:hypothetical protein